MKRSVLLVLMLVLALIVWAETIIPSGSVQGIWNQAGSPYRITGNLTVDSGATLQLDEGVQVIFEGTYKISVSGRILGLGTLMNPISITAEDTLNGWSGIRFQNTGSMGNPPSQFAYTEFSYGRAIWGANSTDPLNFGGAIWASNAGTLTFENCSFYRCKSIQDGSVIYAKDNTSIVMNHCVVKSCESGFFGGVFVKNGSASISNTLFEANTATTFGAGIYLYECPEANVISCKFLDQSAGAVTSIYCFDSPLKVINCLFVNNATTMGLGAGIGAIFGTLTVTNCTFYQNNSATGGAAIWVNSLDAPAQITNSIFWQNTPNAIASTSSSYELHYCSTQDPEGNETNISGDPLFEDAPESYMLSSASPCIDAGSPDTEGLMLPEYDLGGNPRFADGNDDGVATIDIGCYEWQPSNIGFLAGQVIDLNTQDPIAGALIQVDGQSVVTDSEGLFSLELEAGVYLLTCSAEGYEAYTDDGIVITAGQTLNLIVQMETITGLDGDTPALVTRLVAYPNPFTQCTELHWAAKNAQKVEIFNIRGQRIREFSGFEVLNTHKLVWDGRDHSGRPVPAGAYFCKISSPVGSATIKILLIK